MNHPSSQQKREESRKKLKWLMGLTGITDPNSEAKVDAVLEWHEQEIAEAEDRVLEQFRIFYRDESKFQDAFTAIGEFKALRTKAPEALEEK